MHLLRLAFIAVALLPDLALAKFTVEVDRSPIEANGEFQLILSLDKATDQEPELEALTQLFAIEGSSQSQQHQIINGKASAQTQRVLSLRARQPGIYHLPALSWAGESSAPLELRVLPASETNLPDLTDTLFMKAELDQPEVLVGSQAVLSLRVYYAEQIYNRAEFEKLVLDDALVEPLGKERQYQKMINGRRYGVIEKRYALFPQKPGTLAIPALRFTTEVGSSQRSRFPLDVFNRTEAQELRSEPLSLKVQPAPAGSSTPWLPARSVMLKAELSPDSGKGHAGEPLTWTLHIEADGLAAALLPSLQPGQLPGAKLYPDAPSLKQRVSDERLIGTRTEKLALVPTQAGTLRLPEIRLRWWDVVNNKEQVAVLPARELHIAGAAAAPAAPVATSVPQAAPAGAESVAPVPQAAADYWPWLTALCAGGWLATLALWLGRRAAPTRPEKPVADADEAECWTQLLAAVESGHAGRIGQALPRWAAKRFPGQPWRSCLEWQKHFAHGELDRELERLRGARYGRNPPGVADSGALLRALKAVRSAEDAATKNAGALLALYAESER
ncbi:MAG: protein BatD [Gammaproteobacteria bacterium]|nr:protein BatD [Gammaproteobacteria bacterium]